MEKEKTTTAGFQIAAKARRQASGKLNAVFAGK
jgi:hypothetical protein